MRAVGTEPLEDWKGMGPLVGEGAREGLVGGSAGALGAEDGQALSKGDGEVPAGSVSSELVAEGARLGVLEEGQEPSHGGATRRSSDLTPLRPDVLRSWEGVEGSPGHER